MCLHAIVVMIAKCMNPLPAATETWVFTNSLPFNSFRYWIAIVVLLLSQVTILSPNFGFIVKLVI